MKKYYLKHTGEEVKYGDIVALDFEGKNKKGDVLTEYTEVKVTPIMLDLLIAVGVVEEKEEKEEKKKTKEEEGYWDKLKGIKFDIENLKRQTTTTKIEARLQELDERLTELEGIIAEWDNE